MRELLIQILGLSPADGAGAVTDDQIVVAVKALKSRVDAGIKLEKKEKEITDLINQSGGALTRESAKEVLAARAKQT